MNTQALTQFEFNNHGSFFALAWQGQPAFIAQQVCDLLELSNPSKAVKDARLTDGTDFVVLRGSELETLFVTNPQLVTNGYLKPKTQNLILLFESGVYSLIMQSRKPMAIEFRNWVTREVLPTLRREGFYALPKSAPKPDWSGVLVLFKQQQAGERFAAEYLAKLGFTPDGGIPGDFCVEPSPRIVSRLIALAADGNRYAATYLARAIKLQVPPEQQLSMPGV